MSRFPMIVYNQISTIRACYFTKDKHLQIRYISKGLDVQKCTAPIVILILGFSNALSSQHTKLFSKILAIYFDVKM